MTAIMYVNVPKPENVIPKHQQIEVLSCHQWPYLTFQSLNKQNLIISKSYLKHCTAHFFRFRKTENAIFVKKLIVPLSGRQYTYLKIFANWKRDSRISAKRPSCNLALPISHRFPASKRKTWTSANRLSCRMELLIFERFAAWKRYSWLPANRPSARISLTISHLFETQILYIK